MARTICSHLSSLFRADTFQRAQLTVVSSAHAATAHALIPPYGDFLSTSLSSSASSHPCHSMAGTGIKILPCYRQAPSFQSRLVEEKNCETSVWQQPVAFCSMNKSETGPGRERSAPQLPPLHSHRHRQARSEATAALRLSDWSHGEPARRWAQELRRQPDRAPPVPPAGLNRTEPNRTGPGPRTPGCSAAPAARLHLDRADWLPAAAAALLLAAPRRARRLSHSAPSAPPRRWP